MQMKKPSWKQMQTSIMNLACGILLIGYNGLENLR